MRRDFRKKQIDNKILAYSIAGVIVLLCIVFALLVYGNSLDNEVRQSQLSSDKIASIVKNETNTESVSSSIGKSVEEAKEKQDENKTNTIENTISNNKNTSNIVGNTINKQIKNDRTVNKANASVTTNAPSEKKTTKTEETKEKLNFQMPVEGEIICEFAKENLVFSKTLQEWTTHNGIDIKAEKTSIVQAAEDGTVKSIKNDPRYGLTIVIEHENGFQTVYANLLSSEFVTEGENVVKGQSIGTVGNTAAFESADEPHLHFEVIKDGMQVNPSIYVK